MKRILKLLAEPFMQLAVWTVIYSVRAYFFIVFRPKVTFTDPSVQSYKFKEPRIIIANHCSPCDPIMLLSLIFKNRNIVVAKDWFEMKCFHWILTRVHVIPCDRYNLDTEWALIAKKNLEAGKSVIIFPEGKCREDGLMNEFKSGFAFLARSTGVPVVCVGHDGTYKRGHRTALVFGGEEKIERVKGIPSSQHLAERSEYFRQKVWKLKQQAQGRNVNEILPLPEETPEEVTAENAAKNAEVSK